MFSLAACVLLDVCCFDVARECARKKAALRAAEERMCLCSPSASLTY